MSSEDFVLTPREDRTHRPTLLEADLDVAQRAAIELPWERAVLVLGEAGHGKTTVAVHRFAHLWKKERPKAAVIVPTDGLAALIQSMLRRLGVDVEAVTYDRFASSQAHRCFRRLPREGEPAPASVLRVKRAPELASAIAAIAARGESRIDDDRSKRPTPRADLQHLFGDRALLAPLFPKLAVDDVLERTHVQFSDRTEREWSHVTDEERLVPVDHASIDEGTTMANARTIDVEDYAVLFEIDRLRAAHEKRAPKTPPEHDIIAIDEAQELAPLELALIGRSLSPRGTLVVAGDADQQTDPSTVFPGWDDVMRALGRPDHERAILEMGYRCPANVVAMARAVRDGGPLPEAIAFESARALAKRLSSEAERVREDDPRASIAILCRHPKTAARLHERLEVPARLVFDGRFLPRGVQVSTVDEAKGLEFDYVVIPDAHDYGTDALSRRTLYVALTRARHQAVVASSAV